MKNISLISACLVMGMALPAAASTELNRQPLQHYDSPSQAVPPSSVEFAKVIDDLPLMPGLQTVEDDDVLFVSPKVGRIAETTAQGEVDIDDMYMFYRRSLPQLGWKVLDARSYQRDNEILHIDARAEGKITTVEFSVTPAGGK